MGQFRQAHRDPTPADVSGLRGGDGGVTPVFLDGIGSALPSSAQQAAFALYGERAVALRTDRGRDWKTVIAQSAVEPYRG